MDGAPKSLRRAQSALMTEAAILRSSGKTRPSATGFRIAPAECEVDVSVEPIEFFINRG